MQNQESSSNYGKLAKELYDASIKIMNNARRAYSWNWANSVSTLIKTYEITQPHKPGEMVYDHWKNESGSYHIHCEPTGKVKRNCESCKFTGKKPNICRKCSVSDRRNQQCNYQKDPNFVPHEARKFNEVWM